MATNFQSVGERLSQVATSSIRTMRTTSSPEECYVTAYGELFEDCEGAYSTFGDAIKLWCEKTGVSQDGRNEQKMIDFINEYEYEAENTNFCINPITFG